MFVLAVAMNCLSTAEQTYETCAPDDARLLPASTEPPKTRAEQRQRRRRQTLHCHCS